MQELFRQLPAVIYEFSIQPDGGRRFDYVSESCDVILGLSRDAVMKDPVLMERIIHPDDIDDFRVSSASAERTGADLYWQGRMIVERTIRWIEVRSNHELTAEGVIIRRGVILDTTLRRQSSAESETRYQALVEQIKKNETLLTQLFQNVPMAVVLLTDSGKVSQVNKGFEEMFGYSLEDMKDRSINDFIVPEELAHEGVDLHNLIASHRVISIETIRRHRNGKIVNVILYGMAVMLDNQAIGIYGVYVDITHRKRVEEELKIRNAELDNFVYKVSHDLRAPLSSVLGLVNLAKLPGNTDNPMDYIDIIGSKVEHLDHFIGDVLSHSKNLKMDVSNAKVEFKNIVDETFNDLNYLEGAKGISRLIKVEGIDFYSDPWRIAEILRNLISNAIKYRKLDQVTSEIGIRINVDHLRAEISFADNGIGIDEESLSKVFEMFYRATEQSDGSGIGLYIVKNAVEKLGGQITVSSRVGQGTRFNILLPNRINNVMSNIPSSVDVALE
ncbi:MAG TPA: ATP-binding protein [Chryseolinea sp.]|nr:ATP-binding protein [Chryseolinea sp.]